MGAKSRNKGAAFEREVAAELFQLTGISFSRNLEQVRTADHGDLIADDPAWPFLIECKRMARGHACLPSWQSQASKAAILTGQHPAVVYRFDRRPIRVSVTMRAIVECTTRKAWSSRDEWVEISLDGLAYLAREGMA